MSAPDASEGLDDASLGDISKVDAAELLIGRYAVRGRYHARQPSAGLFKQSEQVLMLADVTRTSAGELQLQTQVCEQYSVSTTGITPEISGRIVYPEYLPLRTYTLVLEGGTFRTEGPALEIGYESASPAGCAPGATIAGRTDQPWLPGGKCKCPASVAPPTSTEDCRVIDSDRDNHPGMTVRFSGIVDRTDFVRRRVGNQLVSGSIAADARHTAQYQSDTQNYVLECAGTGCGMSDPFVDCPPSQNRVLFSPLAKLAPSGFPYTCADVLREVEAGEHFPSDPLAFPSGC
ncbi:MAG: hypothetical protein JWN48_1874 [Myxococcaceae bacterium]|nr:hypothetical protein [Myxococcaceae bacterium]